MKGPLPSFWSFNRPRDASLVKAEELLWRGPFSWPGCNRVNNLDPPPDVSGIYILTFEYKTGYIIRSVGVTNSIKRRFSQHNREYMRGNYTILAIESAENGIREEIWHGWGYAKEHQAQFVEHREVILRFVKRELEAYRVFIAEVGDQRKRERIEFALVQGLYAAKEPWANLIDGGMAVRGRYNSEVPIELNNLCSDKIFGLPAKLEI